MKGEISMKDGPPRTREIVYSPDPCLLNPGLVFGLMWKDAVLSRGLAWRLIVRDIKARYRQTLLGWLWAFIPPVVTAGVFVLMQQGNVLQMTTTAIPYGAYALIGSLLWQTFAESVQAPITLVAGSTAMLSRLNFPREALILAAVGETVFNFLIRSILVFGALLWFDLPIGWSICLAPLGVTALIGFGTMLGVFIAPLSVLYHDVERFVALLLPVWMICSGAVIPLPTSGVGGILGAWNPVSPLIEGTRSLLTGTPIANLEHGLFVVVATCVLIPVNWLAYRLAMPHIIARIGA